MGSRNSNTDGEGKDCKECLGALPFESVLPFPLFFGANLHNHIHGLNTCETLKAAFKQNLVLCFWVMIFPSLPPFLFLFLSLCHDFLMFLFFSSSPAIGVLMITCKLPPSDIHPLPQTTAIQLRQKGKELRCIESQHGTRRGTKIQNTISSVAWQAVKLLSSLAGEAQA